MATIAENLTLLKSTKAGIKAAIEAKGVSNVGDKFSDYPAKIASIPTGSSSINNQDKTITSNGTYKADTGYTGLGTVTVKVPVSYSIPNGLNFSYSSGSYTLSTELNSLLTQGTWDLRTTCFRMFSECKFELLELDLTRMPLSPTVTIDATGMFYNTTELLKVSFPEHSSGNKPKLNAQIMFSHCSIETIDYQTRLQDLDITDAGGMFAFSTIITLDLSGGLNIRSGNVNTRSMFGHIFEGINGCTILYLNSDVFNTKDDYDLSAFGSVTMLQGYSVDEQEAWSSIVNEIAWGEHNSQTLTLPVAWQEKIQQYGLESRLTSAWSSVTYQ